MFALRHRDEQEPQVLPVQRFSGGLDIVKQPPLTGYVFEDIYYGHDTGEHHPECKERLDSVRHVIGQEDLKGLLKGIEARSAGDDEIQLCHTREYLELVKREVGSGASSLSTGDADICPRSLEVARYAAGGVLCAVDEVVAGRFQNVFCAPRPPGHHANASHGMGFCIFNNIALGARYAQKRHGIGKVLIVDWDVHHGNGTQDIFYEDGSVLFFSTHQHPWYPGTGWAEETGKGPGRGCTINCPFPAGAGKNLILGAIRDRLLPAARAFKPELVLISAGFDSRQGDPLGRFILTDADFSAATKLVCDLARETAGGRVISVLEGGYDLDGLRSAVSAHVKALTQEAGKGK
jgi:acetoin utilization deacetylase AcuC-like enzyme